MEIKISPFLQCKANVFIYKWLGWRKTLIFMHFLFKLYYVFKRREREQIENAIQTLSLGHRDKRERKEVVKRIFRGILFHYYEKIFNAFCNNSELKKFLHNAIKAPYLKKLDRGLAQRASAAEALCRSGLPKQRDLHGRDRRIRIARVGHARA